MSDPDIYLCYSLDAFGYGYSAVEAYAEWFIAPERGLAAVHAASEQLPQEL